MILDLQLGFCDIHIPRSGGVSRARALLPYLSSHCVVDLVERHWPAWRVIGRIGRPLWDGLYRFAVLRHYREVIESDWRLTLANVELLEEHGPAFTGPWRARICRARRDPSFERFVREEYLGGKTGIQRGGLWRTYCQNPEGDELGVEVIPYEQLRQRWPEICERAGILDTPQLKILDMAQLRHHRTPPTLPELNHVDGPKPRWTKQLTADVDDYFTGDARILGR